MAKVRTFIAVELPREVVDRLALLQETLRESGAHVKWVNRENLHLTLKFLGDVEYEKTNEISQVVSSIVTDVTPFSVAVKCTGTFPTGGRAPRVVWAGIEGNIEPLLKIHSHLNKKLVRFGVPYEKRRFSPHVTIGRVKSAKGSARLVEMIANHTADDFGEADVSELTFMMSELTNRGPIYTPLSHVPFGGE
jgi:2'-5' RNA ligase